MKILLTGKAGQLGSDIWRNNVDHDIYAPDQKVLDIWSRENIDSVIDEARPDVVINTVAFHNVPLCETNPELAFRENCAAVRDLARACNRIKALFITFSTDYVFDGEKKSLYQEDGKPAPLQIYGITRDAVEYAALSVAHKLAIVIRTCGLYGLSACRLGVGTS